MNYTGIGSRKTPQDVCNVMTSIAMELSKKGYHLRSGHAQGADIAFEKGVLSMVGNGWCSIYTPWEKFNAHEYGWASTEKRLDFFDNGLQMKAFDIAQSIHPNWNRLSDEGKKLHARNVFQVLGDNLNSPSDFVLYWAKENAYGEISGGTRTAVMLARQHNIPTINMYLPKWEEKLSFLVDL